MINEGQGEEDKWTGFFKYCPDEGDKWTGSCHGERDRQDLVKEINEQDLV